MKVNAKKLFAIAADKGYMLKDLAAAAGVSYATLQAIKHGETVRVDTLGKLAKALQVKSIDIMDMEV